MCPRLEITMVIVMCCCCNTYSLYVCVYNMTPTYTPTYKATVWHTGAQRPSRIRLVVGRARWALPTTCAAARPSACVPRGRAPFIGAYVRPQKST